VSAVSRQPRLRFDRLQISHRHTAEQLTNAIPRDERHVPRLVVFLDVLPNEQPPLEGRQPPAALVLDRYVGVLVIPRVIQLREYAVDRAVIDLLVSGPHPVIHEGGHERIVPAMGAVRVD